MWAISLCIIISELFFLLGYLITLFIFQTLELQLVFLLQKRLNRNIRSSITGVLCGCLSAYSVVFVTYFIINRNPISGTLWLLSASMVIPLVGLFTYLAVLYKEVTTGYLRTMPVPGRLHAAMMAIPLTQEFTFMKIRLEEIYPEQIGLENDHLGHLAYRETKKYLLNFTSRSLLGVIIGLFVGCLFFDL